MLDMECLVWGSPKTYVQKLKVQHKNNQRLFEPPHCDSRAFGIQHYAGNVVYDTTNFLGEQSFHLKPHPVKWTNLCYFRNQPRLHTWWFGLCVPQKDLQVWVCHSPLCNRNQDSLFWGHRSKRSHFQDISHFPFWPRASLHIDTGFPHPPGQPLEDPGPCQASLHPMHSTKWQWIKFRV